MTKVTSGLLANLAVPAAKIDTGEVTLTKMANCTPDQTLGCDDATGAPTEKDPTTGGL